MTPPESRSTVLNIQRPAFYPYLRESRLQGVQQLPVGGGPPAVQQPALRQQHRAAAYGGDASGVGRGEAQPVDHGDAFLLVLPSAGDDDGIERLARIHFVKTMVGKQVQPGLTVDHLVGLGGGEGNAVARALSPSACSLLACIRMSAIPADSKSMPPSGTIISIFFMS